MLTPQCALCDKEITEEKDTKEHLIPNAIGGRRKVKGFICKDCNSASGDTWESELAKQLNPLDLFFGIIRERGEVPSQLFETTDGDKLKLNLHGGMNIEKPCIQRVHWSLGPACKSKFKLDLCLRQGECFKVNRPGF